MLEMKRNSVVFRNGNWICLDPEDGSVSLRIFLGWYESRATLLFQSLLTDKGIVVDVGANVGWYTLLAARSGSKVYSFEPEPISYSLLQESVKRNKFDVTLKNICLSNYDGFAKLSVSDSRNKGLHSIVMRVGSRSIMVGCATLDSLFPVETLNILKLDAEYAEPLILEGAKNLLAEGRIDHILLEWSPPVWAGRTNLLDGFRGFEIETGQLLSRWPRKTANLHLVRE